MLVLFIKFNVRHCICIVRFGTAIFKKRLRDTPSMFSYRQWKRRFFKHSAWYPDDFSQRSQELAVWMDRDTLWVAALQYAVDRGARHHLLLHYRAS